MNRLIFSTVTLVDRHVYPDSDRMVGSDQLWVTTALHLVYHLVDFFFFWYDIP